MLLIKAGWPTTALQYCLPCLIVCVRLYILSPCLTYSSNDFFQTSSDMASRCERGGLFRERMFYSFYAKEVGFTWGP